MDQIKFKNATVLNITPESTEFALVVFLTSIDELPLSYASFNDENLSEYTIQNAAGITSAMYVNKRLNCIDNVHEVDGGVEITARLSNVDTTELRIKGLEAKIDELINAKGV